MYKLPSRSLAKGYDLLIWVDEEGDVVCFAYTKQGQEFLKQAHEDYKKGDVIEILAHPSDFRKLLPPGIRVGLLNDGFDSVSEFSSAHLH
jgi:hypothetical protein